MQIHQLAWSTRLGALRCAQRAKRQRIGAGLPIGKGNPEKGIHGTENCHAQNSDRPDSQARQLSIRAKAPGVHDHVSIDIMANTEMFAPSEAMALIIGDTGSGMGADKALHNASLRDIMTPALLLCAWHKQ